MAEQRKVLIGVAIRLVIALVAGVAAFLALQATLHAPAPSANAVADDDPGLIP